MTENEAKARLSDLFVSRETLSRIESYVELLDDWRRKLNLIGPREMEHIWARHVLDCAQIIPHVTQDARILDIGTGAGLPGLVLACNSAADGHVSMVESVGKKCAFLAAVVTELGLPATIHNKRVEAIEPKPVDYVTARALAPLPKLLGYTESWISRGATGLFFKGEHWRDELTEAQECWTLAYEAIPSLTSEGGIILKIMEAKRV
ncbi:16S rRNA (guanine(527)-N(7))-methyltransferase RsmG [Henriciella sp.]|uniref:16S rRNA (guanine(527)-N(7))-methyltransferase RsmG n=1 Tax=Henriciella sp. TaxID=1968823 RepID=UPI00262BF035|nr:16S rRNA (guanine(527)-N(7))-methyltransferase RsmG [Henriciella sp.]